MVAAVSSLSFTQSIDSGPAPATASQVAARHDATLVHRFNAGDESAFIEIADRYRQKLFSLALGHMRNRADAEEIAQDVLIRAHRGLARFRGDSSLFTWLQRITLNLARNRYWYYFRRRQHLSISLDTPLGDHAPATLADLVATEAAGPVREIASREFSEQVAICLTRLAAPSREILALRINQDLSYDEIGRKLELNAGTVKSRIARARMSLRLLLAEACPELGADAETLDWFDSGRPSGRQRILSA